MFSKASDTLQTPMAADVTTVDKILHNALDHFSRFGYAGASVREITHASEVTKPTLYYYFKNKEELYKKLAESCFEEVLNNIERAVQLSGTTYDRIIHLISEYCDLCARRTSIVRFIHQMSMNSERNVPDVGAAAFAEKVRGYIAGIIQDGVARGEVRGEHVDAVTYGVIAIFHHRVQTLLMNLPQIAHFQVVQDAIKTILG